MANNLMALSRWMYEAYPIVEGMFFFWLLHRVSKNPTIRIASNIALILVFPVWLAFEWVLPSEEVFGIQEFGIFHMLYRVVAAFLASYTLLLSLERDEPILVNPHFWYLGGILLYNFTTFFVLLIRGTNVAQQLWYLHNVMNIITYLFYSVGFYYAVKSTHLSNRGT